MKYLLISILTLIFSCAPSAPEAVPGTKPDPATEQTILQAIIRYVGKMPDKASVDTRFNPEWDDHYKKALAIHSIDRMYEAEGTGDMYLIVSRIAPSLKEKKVAVGLHLRMVADSITFYHEVFRTWKMPKEILVPKQEMLFAKMIKGEDLSPWYPETTGDEYIEFPNKDAYFDTINRHWVSRLEDPIAPYREASQNRMAE
ncbi:MAG: hypothetical protein KA479_04090 [Saprospiraceae bacterium]|nr:hypothetical protein [Saprospiraceae bacterium]